MNEPQLTLPYPDTLPRDPPVNTTPFSDASFDDSTVSLLPRPDYPAISFLSLNVNKANYIGHAVLNSFANTTDVILFQEPWKGKIGTTRSDTGPDGIAVYGLVHQNSWKQFIPVPADAPSPNPARVSTYVSKRDAGLSVIQRTDLL
jgi:hypothetical protein